MNMDFPRKLTILRKEKKLSQKQAAQELGVSQALLSHYEKGVRECGLDFVVTAARFYDVSCDYLLGMTDRRSIEYSGSEERVEIKSPANNMNRRLLTSATDIIYDLLAKADSRRLSRAVHIYLVTVIYKLFRCIYTALSDDAGSIFGIPERLYPGYSNATQSMLFADIYDMCDSAGDGHIESLSSIRLRADRLAEDYPNSVSALFSVIRQAENTLNKIKK